MSLLDRDIKLVAKTWFDAMKGVPNWPTTMRSNLGDGRLIGVSPNSRDGIGSVWLYKKVPLSPMVDARDDDELERSAAPLAAAFEAMSRVATTVGGRRLAEASYREFHSLTVNVPRRFRPPAGHPLHDILLESFGDRTVEQRLLLFGVRLVPAVDMSGGVGVAVRGFVESLTSAGVPLVEFTKDFRRLDAELTRAGLITPKESEIRLANCWWNLGRYADTPMMPHHNHTHMFGTVEAAVRASRSAPDDCTEWTPRTVPDEWAVTMASLTDFEVDGLSTTDRQARWASMLLNMGALCVSMRGKVEPAKVTRGVIRKNKELYQRDIVERATAGKSSRGEQEARLDELAQVEDHYASGTAPPTIKGLSTVVGFDGNVPDLRDITPQELPVMLAPMSDLQPVALAETYLCSPARGNPTLHDIPAHVVTYSGITSLSVVGDAPKNSILLGLTETDRQPSWMNMAAAANEDTFPICMVPAASGSGKSVLCSIRVPTPAGSTPMGELRVGDLVLGRDGKPCTVTYTSPVVERPDLYRITLSDGQTILADANHQWVVSDLAGRDRAGKSDRLAASDDRARLPGVAGHLFALADTFGPDHQSTLTDLWGLVGHLGAWRRPDGVDAALRMTDCPRLAPNVAAGSDPGAASALTRRAGVQPRRVRPEVAAPRGESTTQLTQVVVFPTAVALKSLATRLLQRHDGMRGLDDSEEMLCTLEILDRGVTTADGRVNFAIRTAAALDLPEADLPLDPYLLGVWLADGRAHGDDLAAPDAESIRNDERASFTCSVAERHDDVAVYRSVGLWRAVRRSGLDLDPTGNRELEKRIPTTYLRGSTAQRLALLQGLMDSDGSIDVNGSCELALRTKDLTGDAQELIRSLGVKVALRESDTAVTGADPDRPGHTRRRVTGRGHQLVFNTDQPVFRLPRKAERLPKPGSLGQEHKWLYVTSIEPVTADDPDDGPARCITVDSADSTYLVAGMVPTHNTLFAQWAAYQTAQIPNALGEKTPVVLINPKPGQSLQALIDAVGGISYRLDELTAADGAVDPLRFAKKPEDGLDLAVSVLLSINPWGPNKDSYEIPLFKALKYGLGRGAIATGQALHIARDELDNAVITQMVDAVDTLLDSVPQVRALVGVHPQGQGLRVSQGLTLIEVGDSHLNLPDPGAANPDVTQRTALALVRMIVFGTMSALTGRQGVVFLDEGWVFTGAGKTEMDRLGRLARSLEVMPVLLSQKVSEALDAGLAGYISRGLILSISDVAEARASFELFKLKPTRERMTRVTAKARMGGDTSEDGDEDSGSAAFDWRSLKALIDSNRVVHRGAVGYYIDLAGRCVPTEIAIPDWFIRVASTNGLDVRARQEAARLTALAAEV